MTTNPASAVEVTDADRFWLIVREPGMVPDRKGPWKRAQTAAILREFMAANPTAFIDVLTIGADGTPDVAHGPEVLQMADGRSMSVGRKHNQRVRAALAQPTPASDDREGLVERLREALTPSADTKAAYIGEFRFSFPIFDSDGTEHAFTLNVPWTTIKEIMKAIRDRAEVDDLSTPKPATSEVEFDQMINAECIRSALIQAYTQGAQDVHAYWTKNAGTAPRGDPEFTEAASDYATAALAGKDVEP